MVVMLSGSELFPSPSYEWDLIKLVFSEDCLAEVIGWSENPDNY